MDVSSYDVLSKHVNNYTKWNEKSVIYIPRKSQDIDQKSNHEVYRSMIWRIATLNYEVVSGHI